jgi:hypothetical protein
MRHPLPVMQFWSTSTETECNFEIQIAIDAQSTKNPNENAIGDVSHLVIHSTSIQINWGRIDVMTTPRHKRKASRDA